MSKINSAFRQEEYFHSVKLDKDLCKGCTNCLKRCPTEAIRVRNGKAKIIKERCIDCGECVRVCPYHAKIAVTNTLDMINEFKYKIALPAPSFYGQFRNVDDLDVILTAFKKIGFDDVFEVTIGAQMITNETLKLLNTGKLKKPIINSACPTIIRLIQQRYSNLIDNILPLKAPVEVTAEFARKKTSEKTGLKESEIGVFFISPCASKMTAIINPIGSEYSNLNGVLSMKDVVNEMAPFIHKIKDIEFTSASTSAGIVWANSGGEIRALDDYNCISVDGIHNVYKVLEDVENDQLKGIDFVECSACLGGCVGGPLTVENPFVAKAKIRELAKKYKNKKVAETNCEADIFFNKEIEYTPLTQLGKNISETIALLDKIQSIYETLPHLDCGSCGAPTCNALSEDIVRGFGKESDCIIKFKEKIKYITNEINELD
jgi:iron only hydrogenase large subunit-like protein